MDWIYRKAGTLIFHDAEWIPRVVDDEEIEYLSSVYRPKENLVDPKKIEEGRLEFIDDMLRSSPYYVEIVAFAALFVKWHEFEGMHFLSPDGHWVDRRFYDEDPRSFYFSEVKDETGLCPFLCLFNSLICEIPADKLFWVGWYNKGADIPIMEEKLWRAGLIDPMRARVNNFIDLCSCWECPDWRGKKLKRVSAAHGIKVHSSVQGGDVLELYRDGKYEIVREYCISDVYRVFELFDRRSHRLGKLIR